MGNPSIVILLLFSLIISGCNVVGDTEQEGDFFDRNKWFGGSSNAPYGLSWSEGTAHNATTVTANWSLSTLSNITQQQIDHFTDSNCSVPEGTSVTLGSAVTSYSFTSGVNGTTFYFTVTATDDEGNTYVSDCSVGMLVDTTAPTAATTPLWSQSTPYNGNPTSTWTVSVSGDVTTQQVNYYSDLCSTGIGNSGALGSAVTNHTYTATDGAGDLASQDIVFFTNAGCSTAEGTSNTGLASGVTTDAFTGSNGNTYYYHIVSYDTAGNSTTSGCSSAMTIDTVTPTLTAVSIASNNTDTSLAKVGDQITISFTASEALGGTPTVQILGNGTSVSGTNPFTATYNMAGGDTEGTLTFTIDFFDPAGNSGTQVTAVTDASSVTFDKTQPTVTVNQATSETIGSCTFTAPSDPTSSTGIEFKILASENINTTTLTTADITQNGTATGITWAI